MIIQCGTYDLGQAAAVQYLGPSVLILRDTNYLCKPAT